jgi:signal transduction histidine kinase
MTEVDRLSVLVHELRSPVAALQAIEETVRTAGADLSAVERRRMFELAAAAGRDIERLLSDPELFSVSLELVDVAGLVASLASSEVSVRADDGLVVEGDPVRLRQAVANLVANGLRHGRHVTVSARENGEEVDIAVSDDGPGIDPVVPDPFAPGVSGAGSSGLGLYVSRAIAEAHGGRLEIVSSPGEGAVFRLALPLAGRAAG